MRAGLFGRAIPALIVAGTLVGGLGVPEASEAAEQGSGFIEAVVAGDPPAPGDPIDQQENALLAISEDGSRVLVASGVTFFRDLEVVNPTTGSVHELLASLSPSGFLFGTGAMSGDGRYVLGLFQHIGGVDLVHWQPDTGAVAVVRTYPVGEAPKGLFLDTAGRYGFTVELDASDMGALYRHDLTNGNRIQIPLGSGPPLASDIVVAADGGHVLYRVLGASVAQVVRRSVSSGVETLVGEQPAVSVGDQYDLGISPDGRYVAFGGTRTDVLTGTVVTLASEWSPDTSRLGPSLSRGGMAAFVTVDALDPADTNAVADAYVWDATTGHRRVSVSDFGTQLMSRSEASLVSGDGRHAAFETRDAAVHRYYRPEGSDYGGVYRVNLTSPALGDNGVVDSALRPGGRVLDGRPGGSGPGLQGGDAAELHVRMAVAGERPPGARPRGRGHFHLAHPERERLLAVNNAGPSRHIR
jgi:hypothetical protein